MRYVILGNGAAGISAAEKLRELNPSDEITMISSENTCVYTKPMLPDYVGGKLSMEKVILRNMDTYKKNRIDLLLNKCVQGIDEAQKHITMSDGTTLPYDKMLIAVGSVPFIPPIKGLEQVEFFCINTLQQADTIKSKAFEGGKAVIVGAGLTGIEMGFALKTLGMQVTIVEREKRLLPGQLDAEASEVMVDIIRHEDIKLLMGTTVTEVLSGDSKAVKLSNRQLLDFDMLLIAIGTRPNINIIKGTDIKCNKGILVDTYMQTSLTDVYAAGDVAEVISREPVGCVPAYIWPNAMAQGKCAAYNMSGQSQEFSITAATLNPTTIRDFPFFSMGVVNPGENGYEVFVINDRQKRIYKKVVLKDNAVKGMIFLNDNKNANTVASLIRKGTNVAEFKGRLLNADFKL